MFLQSSDAIQYSLDASKVLEAQKIEDHVPVFRESIQVYIPGSSALGFPVKKLLADAKGNKPSPHIITDSSLYESMMDPGVPSDTAAGSRGPDPHPKEPPLLPPPSKAPSDADKAPSEVAPSAPKARKSKPAAKSRAVAEPDESSDPVVEREEQADDEGEEEEPNIKCHTTRRILPVLSAKGVGCIRKGPRNLGQIP